MANLMNRDDFKNRTKEKLAKRVGFKCSNPDCRIATIGAGSDQDGVINLGVAAHISAASPGGKRYDEDLTKDERTSLLNGIWLCQTCAKLIDSDDGRYTIPLLQSWKVLAENSSLESERDSVHVTSINQSGGQTAHTIINHRAQKRDLSSQKMRIEAKLKNTAPLNYTIYIQAGDNEVRALADQIEEILKSASWNGKILTMLGGFIPNGIILYRDKESISSVILLRAIHDAGVQIEGQKDFKEGGITIYIGQNPNSYL